MLNRRLFLWGVVFVLTLTGGSLAYGAADKSIPIQLEASAGLGFDSNVPSRPSIQDEDTTRLGYGKGDFFYEQNLLLGYNLPIISDLSLLAQYSLNQNFHFRLGQFDYFSNNFTLTPIWRVFNNSGQLTVLLNYNYLDIGSDKYRVFYTARPVYYQMVTNMIMAEISAGFERRYYFTPIVANQDNPSSKNFQTFIGGYLFLNEKRNAYIQARFTYDKNFDSGSNWDYNGYRITISSFFPIVSQVTGRLYFDLYNQYFTNPWFDNHKSINPVWLSFNKPFPRREDHGVTGGVQFIYTFLPHWSLQANFSYLRNNSNIKWYEYDRYTISMYLAFKY